jgi:hypothetical protein
MGHTLGDGLIVAALAAAFIAYFYFRHTERQRRLEIVHEERVEAMEKGIPLPELPLDPPNLPRSGDPRAPLLHGIVWTALGGGAMLALALGGVRPNGHDIWPLPAPLLFLGIGLMLYYAFASERAR